MRPLKALALAALALCLLGTLPASFATESAHSGGLTSFFNPEDGRLVLVSTGRGVIQVYAVDSQKITLIDQRSFAADLDTLQPQPEPLPAADVPGEDLPGVPRPKDSVRVQYEGHSSRGDEYRTAVYLTRNPAMVVIPSMLEELEGWKIKAWRFTETRSWVTLQKDESELEIKVEPRRSGQRAQVTLNLGPK